MPVVKAMPRPGFVESLKLLKEYSKGYLVPTQALFDRHGDYVEVKGLRHVVFLFHPDAIEHVLKTNHKNYVKMRLMDELKPVLGDGLLTSEGELWREHRRLIAPEFQHKRMPDFYVPIARELTKTLREWRGQPEARNVAPSITRMTYAIAADSFFGADVQDSADRVSDAVESASKVAVDRMARPFKFPLWVPTPAHRKLARAKLQLDQIVYGIIRGRKGRTAGRRDLLSRMLDLNLKESEVRDEVMTLLLAGHETTANAVAWTLYLLGRNPEAQNKLREELNAKVAGEIPTLEELKSLSYCTMVFEEAMRLFPPAAIIGREALQDDQIAGYRIPAGAAVELCQWVTHRHPAFWPEPLRFRPERFERPHQHHPFAYFPFASGPRECVGKNLALVEGVAIIAGLAKNFTFQAVDGHDSRPLPLITLRPDPGVFLKVQPTCH